MRVCVQGSSQVMKILSFMTPSVNVYLVFLLELLHETKLQQTHADQLLQVLMKIEDVFPDVNKNIVNSVLSNWY